MTIPVECRCGRKLYAKEAFAGTRAECPDCGQPVQIPSQSPVTPRPRREQVEEALEITEFYDPPGDEPAPVRTRPAVTWQSVALALLDPRSIHWMLVFGGGLCVLGLIIYLTSIGLFENVVVLASAMIAGTVALLVGGWAVALKTPYRVAGHALTFLACVVAPLNLWFLHDQNLVTLSGPLWVGALVCSLLYLATVVLLRDPLFMYAVEGGVTLTALLFLYSLGLSVDSAHVCLVLMVTGILSIHAERGFPPDGEFRRERFGLPVFWTGHVQLALGLLTLLGTQFTPTVLELMASVTDWSNLLTRSRILPAALWLAGAYAYLYSDIIVRRHGAYTFVAAACVLAAAVTIGVQLEAEVLVILLSLLGLGVNLIPQQPDEEDQRWKRALAPLGLVLSVVPVLMGLGLHWQATSRGAVSLDMVRPTGTMFAVALVLTAVTTRVSAWLLRNRESEWTFTYFALSAASAVVAALGILRLAGLTLWLHQAPLLMLLPLGYLAAARLWRGQYAEQPLGWAAHAATAMILLGLLGTAFENTAYHLVPEKTAHLLSGLILLEAAVFYAMAAVVRRRSVNSYFAAAAASLSLWQFASWYDLPEAYFTMLYAVLGTGLLIAGRSAGLQATTLYGNTGRSRTVYRGPGETLARSGNAILLVAVLCALFQGLARLTLEQADQLHVVAQVLTAVAAGLAAAVTPQPAWRRGHAVGAISVTGVAFLTLAFQIPITPWQKLEIFLIGIGLLLVIVGYVGRFREAEREDDNTTLALWFGSLFCTVPLLLASILHRTAGAGLSLPDELGLVTVCALLLLTGVAFQVKSSTVLAALSFGLYVGMLVITLGWQAQWAVGAYLAIGGGAIFLAGLILSMYRERLVTLPERLANREGLFRILTWR